MTKAEYTRECSAELKELYCRIRDFFEADKKGPDERRQNFLSQAVEQLDKCQYTIKHLSENYHQ